MGTCVSTVDVPMPLCQCKRTETGRKQRPNGEQFKTRLWVRTIPRFTDPKTKVQDRLYSIYNPRVISTHIDRIVITDTFACEPTRAITWNTETGKQTSRNTNAQLAIGRHTIYIHTYGQTFSNFEPKNSNFEQIQHSGVAVDLYGNAFIVDTKNNRIRQIDSKTKRITTVAGSNRGYRDGSVSVATFNTPSSIAVDGAGNIFIADTGNHCIRRWDACTNMVTTVAGNRTATQTPSFDRHDDLAHNTMICSPRAISVCAGVVSFIDGCPFHMRLRRLETIPF